MTRYDTVLFVIAGSIPSQLQDFRRKIFQDSSEVYCDPPSAQEAGR
jgi:hypothetical protein